MQFITFDGRLGKDAEVLTTKGGTKYVRFSVANNTFNNNTENTEWYDVTSYDPFVIEKRAQYFKKGTYVIISGPIRFDVSVKDGKMWKNFYVTANSIDTPSFGKKDVTEEQSAAVTAAPSEPAVSTYTAGTPSTKVVQPSPTYEAREAAAPTYQPSYAGASSSDNDSDLPF